MFTSDTKYWQEKAAVVARKFAGKGLHFVMCDEGKQSTDMAAMKLTELGVVCFCDFVSNVHNIALQPNYELVIWVTKSYDLSNFGSLRVFVSS